MQHNDINYTDQSSKSQLAIDAKKPAAQMTYVYSNITCITTAGQRCQVSYDLNENKFVVRVLK